MSSPDAPKPGVTRKTKSRSRWVWRLAVPAVLAVLLVLFLRGERETEQGGTTFEVRRGLLKITVLEGGSVEALESQKIKSEVKGQTKILSIVEEGYMVTQEDVDSDKILVELDSTNLLENEIAEELAYQNSLAAFTDAKEQFEIQLNQNQSDITSAELEVKFARMDFQKYLAAEVAREMLERIDVGEVRPGPAPEENRLPANPITSNGAAASGAELVLEGELAVTAYANTARLEIDFSKYADPALLGDGEAGQKLRKLEDDNVLASLELGLARTKLEGTKRLAAKDFVTKNDLENEELKVKRSDISLQSAETSKELFIKYEFPKEAEKLLSDYQEALRKLERAKKLAVSKLAQAEAKLNSSEARHVLQTRRRDDIREQIEKCIIRAERSGLVVYGGGEGHYYRDEEQIQEGATVRERQDLITIPDMTEMSIKVKVHESAIKKVKKGQKARITVDAYPDEKLTGEVIKVAVLPDSANRWMNPDVKVYETAISIDGIHEWLKPGMSAQAEILVKELPDVLYVPIQAVAPSNGERVCYVVRPGTPERRVVELGEYNNEFIEIKSALEEAEEVLLRAPTTPEEADQAGEEEKADKARGKAGRNTDREGGTRRERGSAP